MKLTELHLHTLPRYMTDMLGQTKIACLQGLRRIKGQARGLGRTVATRLRPGWTAAARKLVSVLVALLFTTSMSLFAAATPTGSIGSMGTATTGSHHGAAAAHNAKHHEHDRDGVGVAAHADDGDAKGGDHQSHKRADGACSCCSSACHVAVPIDARILVATFVHVNDSVGISDVIRVIEITQIERPPRSTELQLG